MVNVFSAQQVLGKKVRQLPAEWLVSLRRWEAAAPDGSNVQNTRCPKAAGSVAGWETVPLPFQIVRFHFIPTLHLDRKPKSVICFISQIATFSDLH